MTDDSSVAALIVAAGRGQRFGSDAPKQYAALAGQPILRHAAAAFVAHPRVSRVLVVIHPDDRALHDDAVAGLDLSPPVPGGATRQASVLAGLEALAHEPPARVLIHDAARPLVSGDLIDRVLMALDTAPGALPALPVTDSLRRTADGRVTGQVDRHGLVAAQTPQGFDFAAILAAHRRAAGLHADGQTDDVAVALAAGLEVVEVAGEEGNFKVTTAADLVRAERALNPAWVTRVGAGFDVHRFGPGDHVMLCGVMVAHDAALVGHSDADVGLHALTDAILGSIGAGDIGAHFPPSDPQWRGASSDRFLKHAVAEVGKRGGRLNHLDLTLICERPKVGPHRQAMRENVAAICGLALDAVSIKATTTEGLGFTGRREGIAATATATVQLPESD
ncbi:MAG: bifunctional 2-C-methyl-D-erythritol 4-phosphate cytidylyltransferase/2-C-methyl-D-erythritol 2,4-cyclodiphosphate synthase [Alphaproteobacteria bacterium]